MKERTFWGRLLGRFRAPPLELTVDGAGSVLHLRTPASVVPVPSADLRLVAVA